MNLLISVLGLVLGLAGEPDTLKTWTAPIDRIAADPLGQWYLVRGTSLVKYDSKGDSAYSWSEPATGNISCIDAGDPMRVLAYQKDFNLIRFLNNRLAPISAPIRLDDLGITNTLAVASSRRGGFWVIDGSTYRLRQIDMQLKTVVESVPLNLPAGAQPTDYRLIESGDQVLLLIPGAEIQVFDLFANFVKKIPVKVPAFNVYGNKILLVYPARIALWTDPVTEEAELVKRIAGEEQKSLGDREASRSGGEFLEACLYQDKLMIRTPEKVILLRLAKK